jgi:hypothetical protein
MAKCLTRNVNQSDRDVSNVCWEADGPVVHFGRLLGRCATDGINEDVDGRLCVRARRTVASPRISSAHKQRGVVCKTLQNWYTQDNGARRASQNRVFSFLLCLPINTEWICFCLYVVACGWRISVENVVCGDINKDKALVGRELRQMSRYVDVQLREHMVIKRGSPDAAPSGADFMGSFRILSTSCYQRLDASLNGLILELTFSATSGRLSAAV